MVEATRTGVAALACTGIALLAGGQADLLEPVGLDGMCLLALAVLLVSMAMHAGLLLLVRHLHATDPRVSCRLTPARAPQTIVYTERVRFLPPASVVGAAAAMAPLKSALTDTMDDSFAQARSRYARCATP
jgi:hypothetical protein